MLMRRQRIIRIYHGTTLECLGMGRSEDGTGQVVANLQPPPPHGSDSSNSNYNNNNMIAWAGPNCSQLLASVQRKGKSKLLVVFFESNGLRHGEFQLPVTTGSSSTTEVTQLCWSVDSKLLAVALRNSNNDNDNNDTHTHTHHRVQLWHRCNYHWYLVHEFCYFQQKVVKVSFDPEHAHRLQVLLENSWRDYQLYWHASQVVVNYLYNNNSSSSSNSNNNNNNNNNSSTMTGNQ